jgi:hypothetical protein
MEKYPDLNDCKLITASEYVALKEPQFIGQTRLMEDGYFYMVFLSEGVYYKTRNRLEDI